MGYLIVLVTSQVVLRESLPGKIHPNVKPGSRARFFATRSLTQEQELNGEAKA